MAKFKPASNKKKEEPVASTRGLIPCGILIALVMGAIFALMYFSLTAPK
jgi:tetrahydromethanopterin S-methyltransferase subunit F